MKPSLIATIASLTAAGALLVGCSTASTPPTSVSPTSAPAKQAEPTKAPAATPTQQPTAAKKVEFPVKGKAISMVVPWAAGGANDLGARALAMEMEKILQTPVEVVNKAGANSQVGTTDVAHAKPDGYTLINVSLPAINTIYLDPEKKAAFGRKDLVPIAVHSWDPILPYTRPDSSYGTVKALVEAGKAQPDKVKVGSGGVLNVTHLAILELERQSGARFAIVQFNAGAETNTAVLGGHVDVGFDSAGTVVPKIKSGQLKGIGIMDPQPNKYLPDLPTFESQGYKINIDTTRGWAAPAGTPQEVIDVLADTIKKATQSAEHQKRMDDLGIALRYMDGKQFAQAWDDWDVRVKPLMDLAAQRK
jgi:tripartite-type tricarboxylate transporter receptor subunit TctC